MVAAIAAALAVAVVIGALGPIAVLALAVALVQAAVALGWFGAVRVPGATGGVAVVGLAAGAADVLLVVRDDERPLTPLAGVLGLTLVASVLHQLTRRHGRERLTASLATTTTLAVVCVLGAAFLGVVRSDGGAALVVAAALAAGATTAALTAPMPGRQPLTTWRGTAARTATGLLGAALLALVIALPSDLEAGAGVLVGLGCGLVAAVGVVVGTRVAQPDPLVTAGLPLLLAAPAAFVLGRLLVG
jgi:hypothetical protein